MVKKARKDDMPTHSILAKATKTRLFRKMGCLRVSKECYKPLGDYYYNYIRRKIEISLRMVVSRHRRTIRSEDVKTALHFDNAVIVV